MKFSKFLSVVVAVAMIVSCFGFTAMAETSAFSGGSGSQADPYLIASEEDFLAIGSYNGGDNSGVYYKQTAGLNLSGYTPFNFNGNYDGNNQTVELKLSSGHYLALFKELTGNATISNLTIGGSVTGWTGVASVAYKVAEGANVKLSDIVNNATIKGDVQTAGIIGIAQIGSGSVTFENVTNNGSVTSGNGVVGGFVSRADFATFINCRNNGAVTTTKAAGNEIYAGGLVGRGRSYFQKCMNTGTVTAIEAKGNYAIGGILGGNIASITFDDCMNTGELITDGNAGGIIGSCGYNASGPALRRCYTTVATPVGIVVSGGGVYGANTYYLSDSETDSIENITTALSVEDMEDFANFANFSSDVWEMKPETGYYYPQLKNNYIYIDRGTEENPYIIDSAEDFIAIGNLASTAGKYFKQTKSFELSGYTPFNFEGYYDGANNTIKLTLSNAHYLALFNALSGSASVKNLTLEGSIYAWSAAAGLTYDVLENSNVTIENIVNNISIRSDNNTAGIVMYSNVGAGGSLTITNCRNNGNLTNHPTSSKISGGIIGKGKAVISKCINTGIINGGTITGSEGIGGIIGVNQTSGTKVTDCLNVGEINATGNVGGIIGLAGAGSSGPNISKSYTTTGVPVGAVYASGRIEGSSLYYLSDSETDNIDITTALTANQMESLECFVGLSSDIWEMNPETGYFYPQLKNNYVYVEWGTEENPYIIDSAEDFVAIGNLASTEGKYFVQTKSFDLDTHTAFDFSGIYDGGNNTITLSLKDGHYLALFNKLTGNAKVSNLITDGSVKGWTTAAAIALAVADGSNVTISNIVNNADITSTNNVAGIILDASGIGSGSLTITECINNGNITSEASGNSKYNGGILGYGKAVITKCYNTGKITSAAAATGIYGAGGIAGGLRTSAAKIENCFNIGEINVSGNAGGILGVAGLNSSTSMVKTSYTTTSVPVGGTAAGGAANISNVFYLADAENDSFDGTFALSSNDMKDLSKFTGFSSEVWTTDTTTGYDYPQLQNMFIRYEAGTSENPYPISDEESFTAMKDKLSEGVYFELTQDIVLSENYVPYPFVNGILLGNGHTITIDMTRKEDYAGLFTYISGASIIDNIVIDGSVSGTNYVGALAGIISAPVKVVISDVENNAEVTASGARVGGIIGDMYSDSAVSNSTVEISGVVNNGNVSGSGYWVGGITGLTKGGMKLSGLINNGDVYGGNSAGGVVGCAYGHVEKCYNTGSITGPTAGGIVGYTMNGADITSCFNVGNVTKLLTEETSGTESAGGILGSAGANGTVVADCYDAGYLAFAQNAIIGKIDTEKEITAEISNCYYLNPSKKEGRTGTTPVIPEELKALEISDAFVITDGVYPQLSGLKALTSVDTLYVVTVNCGNNGALNMETRYAKAGEPLTISAFPEEGYQISSLTVNGETKTAEDNTYTIEAVNGNTEISVSFEKLILNVANIVKTISGEELVESDYVIHNIGRKYINYYSELILIEVTGECKEAGINLYDGETLVAKIPANLTAGNIAGVFVASESEGFYSAKPYVIDSENNETEGEVVSFMLTMAD